MQQHVAKRLDEYKTGIMKISVMLKDKSRTNFVCVCIAEHLSINETQRLIDELEVEGIGMSHVVVNQLVQDSVSINQMDVLDALILRANPTGDEKTGILKSMQSALMLTHAREHIQSGYLKKLKSSKQVLNNKLTVVELPLLSSEVTGSGPLRDFSQKLVPQGYRGLAPAPLKGWSPSPTAINIAAQNESQNMEDDHYQPAVGDVVEIHGLKATQYNGLEATVFAGVDPSSSRAGVRLQMKGQTVKLSLKPANLKQRNKTAAAEEEEAPSGGGGMFDTVMADPEVREQLKDPKFKKALDDVKENPMMFMQYMGDPEIGPFIKKMMGKFGMGGL